MGTSVIEIFELEQQKVLGNFLEGNWFVGEEKR
jgi:hypothetical protein